jgi:hypothetical protein
VRCAARIAGGTISSLSGRPTASSREYPNVASAAALKSATRPSWVIVMMQSRAASTIETVRSSLWRSRSSARTRTT